MQITNLNPSADIGASAWFLEIDGHNLLMDAGSHPKFEGRAGLPLYPLVQNKDLDAVAITHCHLDHIGSLPMALQHFPRARVLMSELSYFLIERVLHNSVNVMTRRRNEAGITDYPLYTHSQVDDIAYLFEGYKYNREIDWCHSHKGEGLTPTLEFFDAGHALGSAGIMVRGHNRSVFYTGDLCFQDQTILKGARFEDVQADVLIMETTRGSHAVPRGQTRDTEIDRLTRAIQSVQQRNGSILIPTFALGRTQEILALLALLMKQKKLKSQPVYIGGLGKVFTEIYDLEAHRAHRKHTQLRLTEAHNLIVLDKPQQEKMRLRGSRLFVLTAGMLNENTAAYEMALRIVHNPNHAVFFVGYADPDTPGGKLKHSPQNQPFFFSPEAPEIIRQCELQSFDLTAHANRDELVRFVGDVNPELVLLTHGSNPSRQWIADQIHARYPKIKILQPSPGETIQFN